MHHVLFGNCRVGYVEIRDNLVFSQKRHQRAYITSPDAILAQVEHLEFFMLLDRFSQGVHERLQLLKIDKMQFGELAHFPKVSEDPSHGLRRQF